MRIAMIMMIAQAVTVLITRLLSFVSRSFANVAYVPGDGFFPDEGHNNCIRLNYSKLNEEEIERGMTILGQVIKANLKK